MVSQISPTQAIDACDQLIGERPHEVSFPGGKGRESVRLHFAEGTRILTRRPDGDKARREVRVARTLRNNGGPVPEIMAFDGLWMLQEDLGDRRLSAVLNGGDRGFSEKALDSAIAGLVACQEAARTAEPLKFAHLIGFRTDWIGRLVDTPGRIGQGIDVPAPALDREALIPLLRVRSASVIKWDARPANAIVADNGRCAWFDWEECGRRNPPDDLAWLLGDEYMPEDPDTETRLLGRHIAAFTRGFQSTEETLLYLLAFGCFHMTVRLEMILARRVREGGWWPFERCLAEDRVGVTEDCANRLCQRGARWASANPLTAPLADWFQRVAQRVGELDTATAPAPA